MNIKPGYCFDDVLLIPKHSDISTRKNVDLSGKNVDLSGKNVDLSVDIGKGVKLKLPVISANMRSITESAMAIAIANLGGLPILHRFDYEENYQLYQYKLASENSKQNLIGCSIGVKEHDKDYAYKLIAAGCKIICVDVAHGNSSLAIEMTEHIAKTYPEVLLISGNVATREGALRLYNAGANVVKCGIGSGSLCSTRIETGNGVPSLTALEDVYLASFFGREENVVSEKQRKFKIISDGGIRYAGDIVKSLCFSDAVMLGSLLSGTDETPGETIQIDGRRYKEYAGSSTHKTNHIEGVIKFSELKGPVAPVIEKLMEGLRSGCSYQGAHNLDELKEDPEFVSISHAGLTESHPHHKK